MSTPLRENGILKLDPEHYREIDGVVFDADSYAKHIAPPTESEAPCDADTPSPSAAPSAEAAPAAPQEAEETTPVGVFACDPVHVGWYEETGTIRVPIMAGAIAPGEQLCYAGGSGSGSWVSSYATSYRTSYLTSFLTSYRSSWGSGSAVYGAGSRMGSASGAVAAGGYGLELI